MWGLSDLGAGRGGGVSEGGEWTGRVVCLERWQKKSRARGTSTPVKGRRPQRVQSIPTLNAVLSPPKQLPMTIWSRSVLSRKRAKPANFGSKERITKFATVT